MKRLIYDNTMNLDNKYENVLSDLLSLLQQALVRFLTKKPMDIDKFKHYFELIHRQMIKMEDKFHQQKLKFTKYVSKLQEIFKQKEVEVHQVQTERKNRNQQNYNDLPPQKPYIRYKSAHKTIYPSKNLNSIQEEEDENIITLNNDINKRRSGTAGGTRNKTNITTQSHQRPMTGLLPKRRKMNQTINHQITQSFNEEKYRGFQTISAQQQIKQYNQERSLGKKRKSFYDELQKQKKDPNLYITQQMKIPFRSKHSFSQKKWTQKINRFL